MFAKYQVMTSSAKSAGGWGRYYNVVVVETDDIHMPKAINENFKSVLRVVMYRGRLNGTTRGGNTAYDRAFRDAKEIALKLNIEAMGGLGR